MKNGKPAQPRARRPPRIKKEKVVVRQDLPKQELQLVKTLNIVAQDRAQICRDYVAHLVDPANTTPVRVPDKFQGMNPTGLVTSCMSVDVTANLDEDGRFAGFISPTLGDASDPSTYKIALVDTTAQFPTDLTLASSFSQTSATTSLTVDPNAAMLCQPMCVSYKGFATTTNATAPTSDPMGIIPVLYSVQSITSDALNPNLGAAPLDSGLIIAGTPTSIFTLPPGQWDLGVEVAFVAPEAAVRLVDILPGGTSPNVYVTYLEQVGDANTPIARAVVSVYDKPGEVWIQWNQGAGQPAGAYLASLNLTTSWYRPDQLSPSHPGYPLDGGYIRQYHPVAMSALGTCVLSDITDGGNVSCAWLTPDTCATDVFTKEPRPSVGNLSLVENLRRYPGNYDGKLKDGFYQIWKPASIDDTKPYKPTAARDREWPCLAFAGQVSKTSNLTGRQFVLRLKVFTTYQYYTDIVCFPLQKTEGSTAIMEEAFRLVQTFPTSSANGPHWENIKNFFRTALGFVKKNAEAIGTGATQIGQGVLTLASIF